MCGIKLKFTHDFSSPFIQTTAGNKFKDILIPIDTTKSIDYVSMKVFKTGALQGIKLYSKDSGYITGMEWNLQS